jgi:hypothetical protein
VRLSPDLELRKLNGLWYAVQLATLPQPAYRLVRRRTSEPRYAGAPRLEREVEVRHLVTPPVIDVVTGQLVHAGPEIDDEAHRKAFAAAHSDRRYACAKRQLSRAELRQHNVSNQGD